MENTGAITAVRHDSPTLFTPADWHILDVHELAAPSPPMGLDAFNDLVLSIKRDGYDPTFPLVLCRGFLLDGRARRDACMVADMEPVCVALADTANPADFLHRAHAGRRDVMRHELRHLDELRRPGDHPRKTIPDLLLDALNGFETVSAHDLDHDHDAWEFVEEHLREVLVMHDYDWWEHQFLRNEIAYAAARWCMKSKLPRDATPNDALRLAHNCFLVFGYVLVEDFAAEAARRWRKTQL